MNSSGTIDLRLFDNSSFDRGKSKVTEILWRGVSGIVFQTNWFPFYAPKRFILRCFGARIGKGVLIKPRVSITFPWRIVVGNHSWIGEEVWLDSLDRIEIGSNVCISQRTYLCTGSHNSRSPHFDLVTKPILVADGAWIGAGSVLGPGVSIGSHAFVTLGSVVTDDIPAFSIASGNPAVRVKEREIRSPGK